MKKFLALFLALVTLFSLAACGTTPVEEPAKTGDEFYANATAPIGTKMGDSNWDGTLPLVDDDYEITVGIRTSALVTDYETNDLTLWLEEKTGVKITVKEFAGSSSDVATQLNLMISGGEEWPDIFFGCSIPKATLRELGREGFLLNMAGYFQTDAHYSNEMLHRYHGDGKEYEYAVDQMFGTISDPVSGQVYMFPQHWKASRYFTQAVINKTWLDKLGLEMPTNVHELYDVLVAFRDRDPNGNGKKDEIPMIGRDNVRSYDMIGYLINAYIQYLPTYTCMIENGKVFVSEMQDEYREALKFLNKLCKEGLLAEQTFTAKKADISSLLNIEEGEVHRVGVISFPLDEMLDVDNPIIYDYEPLPVMAGETDRGGYGMLFSNTWNYNTIVNAKVERPEVVFRLLDFMCSPEGYLNQRWGKQGVSWDWLPADKDGTGKGHFGGDAKIEVYKQNTLIETSNESWHTQYSFCSERYWGRYLDKENEPWLAEIYTDMIEIGDMYEKAKHPEEMLYIFVRTEEEEEIFQEYNTEIKEHINRSRADFIIGRRDPNDDADWQKYVKELEDLQIQRCWIDICQASLDRYKATKR